MTDSISSDWRGLCEELLGALEDEGHAHWPGGPDGNPLIEQTRAALAAEADGPAVPEGREPASVVDEVTAALALRLQRLEEMRETEKAALLDAFRQIDDLKQRIDFQYWKIHQLEEAADPTTSENI